MNYSILTTTMITLFLIANTSPAQVSPPHTEEETLTIAIDDEIFCPDLNAFVGDICDDADPETDYDFIDEDCTCTGFASSFCNFFQYYLADHDPETGVSDIYNVNIENG